PDPGMWFLLAPPLCVRPRPEAARLDDLAPTRIEMPSGSRIRLDYPDADRTADGQDTAGSDTPAGPVLAVKLQECFGWRDLPRICESRVSIPAHLLSPAGSPLAVTADLASFWANAYGQVRAENRGRYPKHPWPED